MSRAAGWWCVWFLLVITIQLVRIAEALQAAAP